MALTHRGKVVAGVISAVAVVAGALVVLTLTGNAPEPLQRFVDTVTGRPTPCPLTGEPRRGDRDAPSRPAFGVKVENTDDAYPLAGLDRADVIYEELVEGGITRFVAIYQCSDAGRVGPVRSARTTDPKLLVQLADEPLLAYSGANPEVSEEVDAAGVVSFTESSASEAFARDDARVAPHNLFASVKRLYRAARAAGAGASLPAELFVYDEELPRPSKPRTRATVVFSTATTAEWRWSGGAWVRHLDGVPMRLENGRPISATNVVIQEVVVTASDIVDVSGAVSPEVDVVGTGRAWILRDGRLVVGRWRRPSLGDVTIFERKDGSEIALAPGSTFVELIPREDGEATFER